MKLELAFTAKSAEAISKLNVTPEEIIFGYTDDFKNIKIYKPHSEDTICIDAETVSKHFTVIDTPDTKDLYKFIEKLYPAYNETVYNTRECVYITTDTVGRLDEIYDSPERFTKFNEDIQAEIENTVANYRYKFDCNLDYWSNIDNLIDRLDDDVKKEIEEHYNKLKHRHVINEFIKHKLNNINPQNKCILIMLYKLTDWQLKIETFRTEQDAKSFVNDFAKENTTCIIKYPIMIKENKSAENNALHEEITKMIEPYIDELSPDACCNCCYLSRENNSEIYTCNCGDSNIYDNEVESFTSCTCFEL